MVQGFSPAPKSSRAVAFCCGIPSISNQIKVAENTRDLSGLVGGGAGVRRLRPQGQRPARSDLSEELALSHMCHCPFPLEPCRFEGKAQQALGWRRITLTWLQVRLLRNVAYFPHSLLDLLDTLEKENPGSHSHVHM